MSSPTRLTFTKKGQLTKISFWHLVTYITKNLRYPLYKEIRFSNTVPGKIIYICLKNGFQIKCGEIDSIIRWRKEKPQTDFHYTSKCEKKIKKKTIMYKALSLCQSYAATLATTSWKTIYRCSFESESCIKTKSGRSKREISCQSNLSTYTYRESIPNNKEI